MKILGIALSVTFLFLFSGFNSSAQNMGINATGATPDASALLDLSSTNSGFLITRVDTANITSPAFGLITLSPIDTCLYLYNGLKWMGLGGGGNNCICNVANSGCIIPPTTSSAGPDQTLACGVTTVTLAGNVPLEGIGTWSVVSGTGTITNPSSPTSSVTCLSTLGGTTILRWTIFKAPPCIPSTDDVIITTTSCNPSCGTQEWAIANLNSGTQLTSSGSTQQLPPYNYKYCYNNIAANCATYGGMYEWDNVMLGAASINCDPCGSSGVQGMCPVGFHIPTDLEWSRYEFCVENNIAPTGTTTLATFQTTTNWRGSTTAGVGPGDKMKVTDCNTPAWDGTNTSGFAALPGGYRNAASGGGGFSSMGSIGDYWSATEYDPLRAWIRGFGTGNAQTNRYGFFVTGNSFSVRCLKD